ncbi:MAG TPA: hypothetical protein OIM48_04640 [Clostridiaceae bacterium]|nr:hypothetical protein [Clostridiaceae bacterium]
MKDYTLTLTKILGKDKYQELVDYSFEKVQEKFGNIKTNKAVQIVKINHQNLMIISMLKAKNYKKQEIIKLLHWDKKNSYKFIIANSFDEFVSIYEEYISLIIKFVK